MTAVAPRTIRDTPALLDRAATAAAIAFAPLVDALRAAALDYEAGRIRSPERLSVPLAGAGVSLSMPASAADIAVHKLVNVQPSNTARGLPLLHGIVTVSAADTGRILCLLDGPEVTGRRTAGVSLLGIATFLREAPSEIVLIGTGAQAGYHLQGIHALHPSCRVLVRGSRPDRAEAFCRRHASLHANLAPCPPIIPDSAQVVIAVTSSREPVIDLPPSAARLVIGAGAFRPDMAEIGPATLHGSAIFVDDRAGARHEAGDLLHAGVDWRAVRPLAAAIADPPRGVPVVFKTVGSAAWDLAAARVALSCRRADPVPPTADQRPEGRHS